MGLPVVHLVHMGLLNLVHVHTIALLAVPYLVPGVTQVILFAVAYMITKPMLKLKSVNYL